MLCRHPDCGIALISSLIYETFITVPENYASAVNFFSYFTSSFKLTHFLFSVWHEILQAMMIHSDTYVKQILVALVK